MTRAPDTSSAPDSEPVGPAVVVNGIRQDCGVGVWDNAFEYAETRMGCSWNIHEESFADGAEWGVRWICAIIGMAEAIRRRELCPHGLYYRAECIDCLEDEFEP